MDSKYLWRERLKQVKDYHALLRHIDRHRDLFTSEDRLIFQKAGDDAWPRIFRYLRQELRMMEGQEGYIPPRGDNLAAAALRRVWTPSRILRKG